MRKSYIIAGLDFKPGIKFASVNIARSSYFAKT